MGRETEERRANGTLKPGHRVGFKPGQSGNPNGTGDGTGPGVVRTITAALKERMRQGDTAKRLAETVIDKALEGDAKFMALALDRIDGKLADVLINQYSGPTLIQVNGLPEDVVERLAALNPGQKLIDVDDDLSEVDE